MSTPDDIRAEYNAVVSYHTALVVARFTIAGLVMAASGFLPGSVLKTDVSLGVKTAGCALGAWLASAAWVLELRTRCLYTSLAHRGVDIEHRYWGLTGADWYTGFFSRQHKLPPPLIPNVAPDPRVPPKPGPDIARIALFCGWAVPERYAELVSHSMGFDLIYFGAFVFWCSE